MLLDGYKKHEKDDRSIALQADIEGYNQVLLLTVLERPIGDGAYVELSFVLEAYATGNYTKFKSCQYTHIEAGVNKWIQINLEGCNNIQVVATSSRINLFAMGDADMKEAYIDSTKCTASTTYESSREYANNYINAITGFIRDLQSNPNVKASLRQEDCNGELKIIKTLELF